MLLTYKLKARFHLVSPSMLCDPENLRSTSLGYSLVPRNDLFGLGLCEGYQWSPIPVLPMLSMEIASFFLQDLILECPRLFRRFLN